MDISKKKSVAFLGLGAMGQRVAGRLTEAGHRVYVYNRSPAQCEALVKQGASAHGTPREAAESADIVIAMVRDDAASIAVWSHPETGALAAMAEGAHAIELSTLSADRSEELDVECQAAGIAFLNAPVVGTLPHAAKGELTLLMAGSSTAAEACSGVLKTISKAQHYIGPRVAQATSLKLATNSLFAIQVAALGECFAMMRACGLDEGTGMSLLATLPVTSPIMNLAAGLILEDSDLRAFPIELVHKDMTYANSLLARTTPSVLCAAIEKLCCQAVEAGRGEQNIHRLALDT